MIMLFTVVVMTMVLLVIMGLSSFVLPVHAQTNTTNGLASTTNMSSLSIIPDNVVLAVQHQDDRAKILHGFNSPQEQITMADVELVNCINQWLKYGESYGPQSICDSTLSSMYSIGNFNHPSPVSGPDVTNMSQLAIKYFKARGILP